MLQLIFATLTQVVLAFALPYFLVSVILGIRVARKGGQGLGAQERAEVGQPADPSGIQVYMMVPCLNEEAVVAATVASLLADPTVTVIVIDDGSDDATAVEARRGAAAVNADERLLVLSRRAPHARHGKGAALNAGYRLLTEDVRSRGLDPSLVVVGVMDGDGHLSPGAVQACLPLFEDPRVGGVQLSVRIRDRRRLIAQFQDVEFWMISAMSQFARSTTGTVSLGGNGQFTRLVALQDLEGEPWSDSLTEDLDLGLRLIAGGWRITTTTSAYVNQQAVGTYGGLLRQRTRWYQGHMTCIRRLPELWGSYRQVNQVALMEVTSYLLVPWLIVLPWSILQQWIFFQLVFDSGGGIFATDIGPLKWRIAYLAMFYVISFLPNLLIGVTYARRTRAVSIGRALLLAHLMIIWNYVGYVATWRALGRMIRGRHGWVKTSRAAELDTDLGLPRPAAVLALSAGGSEGNLT